MVALTQTSLPGAMLRLTRFGCAHSGKTSSSQISPVPLGPPPRVSRGSPLETRVAAAAAVGLAAARVCGARCHASRGGAARRRGRSCPQRAALKPHITLQEGEVLSGPTGQACGGAKLRVLLVIHGYPPLYNAGSEVYTQTLARALQHHGHKVLVFCREEDTIAPYFRIREDSDGSVPLKIINIPNLRDRYQVAEVDRALGEIVEEFQPDVVHCGHLNHLSTSLVPEVSRRGIPFVYTLHDFWLLCPRGQFLQFVGEDSNDLWPLCDGQEDHKCAKHCYAPRMGSGAAGSTKDLQYWSAWVGERMRHIKHIAGHVDLFISPARHLQDRFVSAGLIPRARVTYLDYGFDRARYAGRQRTAGEPFTFGYIGTHKESKGVQHLIEAFAMVTGTPPPFLRIFGRPMAQSTAALGRLAARLVKDHEKRVEWRGEYVNDRIVADVFNHVDAIVVPSIWVENSPLVIHEAQQAGVLVITANVGGMAEYVAHDTNGLLFEHRDPMSLATQMQRCVFDPSWASKLGAVGYLHSVDGQIPSVREHVLEVIQLYRGAIMRCASSQAIPAPKAAPAAAIAKMTHDVEKDLSPPFWRITLDTNPDDCNLKCDMCEGFSQYSTVAQERWERGLGKRRMDPDLMERVVVEFVNMNIAWSRRTGKRQALEVIPSTMGEPLLYAHFERLLRVISREDKRLRKALGSGAGPSDDMPLGCAVPPGPWAGLYLNLTTNGTFPRFGAARWAELILPLASDVKISWNGASKATQEGIMRGQDFNQVLENVQMLARARDALVAAGRPRCRLTFQLTFLEENYAEIPRIVELAARLGIDRVKGHHLWGHWPEMDKRAMKRDAAAVARWNSMVPEAQAVAAETGVLLEGVSQIPADAAHDLAPGAPCPFLGKEAWVSAEGRFNPCCAPDAQRLELGYFGHLTEQGLGEIAEGGPYQDLKATYATRDLCKSCNMRRWPRAQLTQPADE